MVRAGLTLTSLLLAAAPAWADVVELEGGGRLEGEVTDRGDRIEVETAVGRVVVSKDEVARIEASATPLDTYLERAEALAFDDLAGHRALAKWAEQEGLPTRARAHWRRILTSRPDDAEAHRALGHVKHEGRWMSPEERQRALGKVRYGGEWVDAEVAKENHAKLRARHEEAREARAKAREEAREEARVAARRSAEAEAARARDRGPGLVVGWTPLSTWTNAPLVSGFGYPRALWPYTLIGLPPRSPLMPYPQAPLAPLRARIQGPINPTLALPGAVGPALPAPASP